MVLLFVYLFDFPDQHFWWSRGRGWTSLSDGYLDVYDDKVFRLRFFRFFV